MSESYLERDEISENVTPDMIIAALVIIEDNALTDGARHKQWVIDQALRVLLGEHLYAEWRERMGGSAAFTYYDPWEEGKAP